MVKKAKPLELACDGHPQVAGVSEGVQVAIYRPQVLETPVLEGQGAVDGGGVSIYGSVIRDNGIFRMWYQATPQRPLTAGDTVLVGCVESDDGLSWRRPSHRIMEWEGRRDHHLTDLPFHCPSVVIDPQAPPQARYRAFGCTGRRKLADLPAGFPLPVEAWYAYHSAHSADGLHWTVDGPAPAWPWADVITSVRDPWAGRIRVALKRNGRSAGLFRRRFCTADYAAGRAGEAVTGLIPDEFDDQAAQARGFASADYYGLGWMPGPTVTVGFLWIFRHQAPLGADGVRRYGKIGCVDVSLVYQTEPGGRWQHLPGRPDWLATRDMPEWASGALYTAAYPLEVGDETWLYFTGTADRHGWRGEGVERDGVEAGRSRIGLARWPAGRLMGYESRLRGIVQLEPRQGAKDDNRLCLNLVTRPGGRVRAQLLDDGGQPIPGYAFDDCEPLTGDHLKTDVRWRGKSFGAEQRPTAVQLELQGATLYGFEFTVAGIGA